MSERSSFAWVASGRGEPRSAGHRAIDRGQRSTLTWVASGRGEPRSEGHRAKNRGQRSSFAWVASGCLFISKLYNKVKMDKYSNIKYFQIMLSKHTQDFVVVCIENCI